MKHSINNDCVILYPVQHYKLMFRKLYFPVPMLCQYGTITYLQGVCRHG